ncbi:hypothetical protein [Micromonospora costi]|uniref:Uncharacterized protein n=1 Tax=Micromonospora costi TaxID=1530042 RepID=A0A3B0A117_9ACTN|nr:hypothetical protein [Micromonospora costi]RKN53266.1 hypothetical protein D7193_24800 [Micromonospora costi]
MGLTSMLHRLAARHAHVLLVETPGHWLTRVAAEHHLLDRGWRLAQSPADADVLAVCGTPGVELATVADRLWQQMPGPRVRIGIESPEQVRHALDIAEADLRDITRQQTDSRVRRGGRGDQTRPDGHPTGGHGPHGDHAKGGDEHAGHAGHAGVAHGDMDMAPAGIPLANRGEDRDGLELDVLHVRLGPVLAYWPAGLVLRCTLSGDVIVDAQASLTDPSHRTPEHDSASRSGRLFAARRCDNAASLLALAGAHDAASGARQVRDILLDPDGAADAPARLARLTRTVRRSWLLRWSLRRLGSLSRSDLVNRDLPDTLEGDAHDRLLGMLDRASRAVAEESSHRATGQPTVPVEAVAELVRGWDLATARLIVASLDLDAAAPAREVSRV